MTKVYAASYEPKSVSRLNYGIYFKLVDTINVMNDNQKPTVTTPLPHRVQLSYSASRHYPEHSQQNDRAKLACDQLLQFWYIHNEIHKRAESRMKTLFDAITTLMPSCRDIQRDRRSIAHNVGNFV